MYIYSQMGQNKRNKASTVAESDSQILWNIFQQTTINTDNSITNSYQHRHRQIKQHTHTVT